MRAVWLNVAAVAVVLTACGGPAATSAATPSSTQSSWQVVLTLKDGYAGFGITGVTLDGHGHMYLAEFDVDRIYEYSTSGQLITQWGTHGSGPGQLDHPDKLAIDGQGNVYVSEVGAASAGGGSRIQKFSPTGTPLAQWGTFGRGPGQFDTPVGVAVDPQGDIYVADVGNHRIQKLSPSGQPLMQWHTVGTGSGESTEIGYDLALDASGNVYVSEPHPFSAGHDWIQKFSPTGALLAQWGGNGSARGQLNEPTGITVDGKGDVFVVDSDNNRIQEFSATGRYLAQWSGSVDPRFGFLSKIAVDDHRNMYVSRGTEVVKLTATTS